MKYFLKLVIVCLFTAVCVGSETCRTPKNEDGECVPLTECRAISEAHTNRKISDDDLDNLRCGGTSTKPKICCKPSDMKGCKLPGNRIGECKPLYSCKQVLIALAEDTIQGDYVERIHCGGSSTSPNVCCGEIITNVKKPDRYPLAPRKLCGLQHVDDYFHHGEDETAITEFPWVARIGYQRTDEKYEEFLCSGSLINDNYVLTAAQCLNDSLKPMLVRLGEYHSYNKTDCAYYSDIKAEECSDFGDFGVEKYIRHPGYNNKPGSLHDIGLIKLDKRVAYTDYIRPVCLLSSKIPKPKVGDQLTISSWGWTTQIYNIYIRTKFKQKTTVRLTTAAECDSNSVTLEENQACTIYTNTKTCLYENGGPVVYSYKYQWFQEGIALSGSKNCVGIPAPLLYTNVSNYIDWIQDIIDSN